MKKNPFISVCLPLYDTEPYLALCLRSVFLQNFDSYEVIILSDASRGKNEKGRNARKISNSVYKECSKIRKEKGYSPVEMRFVEHKENRGLIEVRRSLFYEAKGRYICYVDSDDVMEENALAPMYKVAEKEDADIIHGSSTSGYFDSENNFIPSKINRYSKITIGKILNHDIFRTWITGGNITGLLWAKLIKRELLEKAFDKLPYTECNMADDMLIFFFVAFYAKSYVGIEDKVYRYRMTSGMSSTRKINSLARWRLISSTASVFTVISESEEIKQIDEIELNCVRYLTTVYLANNLKQLRETVIPELQPQAREMLCEYWGASFVERVEKSLK